MMMMSSTVAARVRRRGDRSFLDGIRK
jgi:hypothetical protein